MRVLLVNRSDALVFPGGAKVQVEKTAQELKILGVECCIKTCDSLIDKDFECDLIHIFGIQNAHESFIVAKKAEARGVPWVLSPIYWTQYEEWFGYCANKRAIWRILRETLGYKKTYWVYDRWQRLKSGRSEYWGMQNYLIHNSLALLPNSVIEAKAITFDYHLPRKKQNIFFIIPNGIEPRLFTDRTTPKYSDLVHQLGDNYLLQVGRISIEKNNLGLIKALFDFPYKIVFTGPFQNPYDANYYQECLNLAKQRGNVIFTGEIPYENLWELYRNARVHVLPSWRETPGLVSLEAAVCGCNIVSTEIGSAREYLGNYAWYCHPGFEETIRTSVLTAMNSPHDDNLRDIILKKYTWEKAALKTLEAYTYVLLNN